MNTSSFSNYLPLYYLNACGNKNDAKGCGLLGSAYMLNMLNNGGNMSEMNGIFPLVAINKFLNNNENRKTLAGLYPLLLMSGNNGSLFGGKKQKNNDDSLSEYNHNLQAITNINNKLSSYLKTNKQTGGDRNLDDDIMIFGGSKRREMDNIDAVSYGGGSRSQKGGIAVSPSNLSSDESSSDIQSYTSTDYSYNSLSGGRVIQGCKLGDSSVGCSSSYTSTGSSMELGGAFSQSTDVSTQSGGDSHLTGSTIGSISTSNGSSMESQSIFSKDNLSNNLNTQYGGAVSYDTETNDSSEMTGGTSYSSVTQTTNPSEMSGGSSSSSSSYTLVTNSTNPSEMSGGSSKYSNYSQKIKFN